MTLQARLSEIEEKNLHPFDGAIISRDVPKLVSALRCALNTIERQSHPHIESFCKERAREALTEIERILEAQK